MRNGLVAGVFSTETAWTPSGGKILRSWYFAWQVLGHHLGETKTFVPLFLINRLQLFFTISCGTEKNVF